MSQQDNDPRPVTYRGAIYPWHCDHVGHMNVMWYVNKFDEATWQLFFLIGLTPSMLRESNKGMAALEQHISYRRELTAGDLVTVRTQVLEIGDKVVRFSHEMVNTETEEIAATTELTGVFMDKQARRSCAFPAKVRARAEEMLVTGGEHG